MNTTKITVETTILVDKNKVWDFWTQPEHITKWNFASEDWHCSEAENDLQVGGTYRVRMEAKDGSYGFDFESVYDQIIDKKKIAYTMTDGRKAITHFNNRDGKTTVSTTFDAENENSVEMQRDGWQAILNNFKKYVETNY